jgi:hypothetical protein
LKPQSGAGKPQRQRDQPRNAKHECKGATFLAYGQSAPVIGAVIPPEAIRGSRSRCSQSPTRGPSARAR